MSVAFHEGRCVLCGCRQFLHVTLFGVVLTCEKAILVQQRFDAACPEMLIPHAPEESR